MEPSRVDRKRVETPGLDAPAETRSRRSVTRSQTVQSSPRSPPFGSASAASFPSHNPRIRRAARPAIRRQLVPATTAQYIPDVDNPAADEVKQWIQNYAKAEIGSIVTLARKLPANAGASDADAVEELYRALITARNTKPYNGATVANALAKLIDDANALEVRSKNTFLPPNTDLTTQVAAAQFLDTLQDRYRHVRELVDSLDAGTRAPIDNDQGAAALVAKTNAENACGVGAPYVAATAGTALVDFASATSALQNAAEADVEKSIESTMKIGTEFTFTHPSIVKLNPEKPTEDNQAWETAMDLIESWQKRVVAKNVGECTVSVSRDPINEGGHGKHTTVPRFTYTWGHGQSWWWRLNVDFSCIEMQTQPTTGRSVSSAYDIPAQERMIHEIIKQHIFGLAATLRDDVQLAPDDQIGGGHLTLDAATTIGTNARFLRNLLVLYANDSGSWQQEDADKFNAPTIAELDPAARVAFIKVISGFDQAYNRGEQPTIEDLRRELVGRVYVSKHFVEKGNDPAIKTRSEQPAHYQATNLEHISEQDPRLEMRRFDAQQNVDDLLSDIGKLTKLVAASRQPGLVALNM